MIVEELILFMLLGALTGTIISYIVTGHKRPMVVVLLGIIGAFSGSLSGTVWIIATGGLDVTLFAYMIPILIASFLSFILLNMLPKYRIDRSFIPGRIGKNIGVITIILLAFFIAFTAFPLAYPSSQNMDTYSIQTLDWESGETIIQEAEPSQPVATFPIEITHSKSSVSFTSLSENPSVGNYLDFKLFLTPSERWNQPYLKIAVYQDKDNSLSLTDGDVLWSDTDYKLSTSNSLWRINCLYNGTQPKYGVYTLEDRILPIIHANTLTPSLRDQTKTFLNTPEKFKPEKDMISWDEHGPKDTVINYATIKSGQTSTLQGRIYAKTVGNHIIVVEAYDATSSDPYSDTGNPLKTQVIPFTVTTPGGVATSADGEQVTSSEETILGVPIKGVILILGVFSLVGLLWARKEKII